MPSARLENTLPGANYDNDNVLVAVKKMKGLFHARGRLNNDSKTKKQDGGWQSKDSRLHNEQSVPSKGTPLVMQGESKPIHGQFNDASTGRRNDKQHAQPNEDTKPPVTQGDNEPVDTIDGTQPAQQGKEFKRPVGGEDMQKESEPSGKIATENHLKGLSDGQGDGNPAGQPSGNEDGDGGQNSPQVESKIPVKTAVDVPANTVENMPLKVTNVKPEGHAATQIQPESKLPPAVIVSEKSKVAVDDGANPVINNKEKIKVSLN